jgi:hypothetical protein
MNHELKSYDFFLASPGGHPKHPSPMLSLLGKMGTTSGSLKGVAYHSQS